MSQAISAPVAEKFMRSQRALVLARYGYQVDRSQRARDRWDARWAESLMSGHPTLSDPDIDRLVAASRADDRGLTKAVFGPRLRAAVERLLEGLGDRLESSQRWFAREVSDDAGQHALDMLGLNLSWEWEPRSAAEKLLSAEGSRALEDLYGKHVERLTKIVHEATHRKSPLSVDALRKQIREEWEALTEYQAELIARTESAHVWEATNYLASVANGVQEFDWIVAVGPSVKPGSICTRCLGIAARNPHPAANAPLPPRHPLCRCTLVPSLSSRVAIPETPWTGGPLPA